MKSVKAFFLFIIRPEVENDFLRRVEARHRFPAHILGGRAWAGFLATPGRVLLSLLGPGIIKISILREGHRQVRLLEVPNHFLVQRLLQPLGGSHHGVSVGVLSVEIGFHLGIGLLAQPEVIVDATVAVKSDPPLESSGRQAAGVPR
jgi:hypothetical protein